MGLLDSLPLVNPDDRKRNMLADLLRGATGLLDEARPKVQDSWRNGLLSILNPEANQQRASDYLNRQNVTVGGKPYDYNQAMSDMAITGIAPLGMLAYHGSPHKFDKFSLDKIGTGEGAQAYGHGLYLAETEDVAKRYRDTLTNFRPDHIEASLVERGISPEMANTYAQFAAQKQGGPRAFDDFASVLNEKSPSPYIEQFRARMRQEMPKLKDELGAINGHLYKTDIPDEAVARFLDWDKPLSQQAPEVQAALGYSQPIKAPGGIGWGKVSGKATNNKTGADAYLEKSINLGGGSRSDNQVSEYLRQQGIPGIRYLDGGSRGTGTGTSNFVVFDPDMIRILERNGQSTGAQPWQPGEYQNKLAGLLDNSAMNAAPQFKISDVFGDGSRLDHYDYAKGLMYSQQKMPNGKSKWSVFETYPVSEGGDQLLGQMFQHPTIEDAIKSVRGARISQTLKANNAAKYGSIPNTWDGDAKRVAKKLIDSGVGIDRFGQSTQSTSRYIYLEDGRKVRLANHDLPSAYDAPDFDHRYGSDISALIANIKQSP